MLGDMLLIWDPARGFWAGWKKRPVNGRPAEPAWTWERLDAKHSTMLGYMQRVARQLGARVISESESLRIEALRRYRARERTLAKYGRRSACGDGSELTSGCPR